MGSIDKTSYSLICPECGAKESASVLDKGSGWSGSSWQSGASFSRFDTSWEGGGHEEPRLTSAFCKICNVSASIKSGFGNLV